MNQYTLDGIPLKDPQLRWFPDRKTGIRILPARRQPEQRYPFVDGEIFIPAAPYDPGAVEISLEVHGSDYADMRKNLEFLSALIGQRHKLIPLRDHYDKVSTNDRIAQVSLASSVEPEMINSHTSVMRALFSVPETFWRSAGVVTGTSPVLTNAAKEFDLSAFAGSNAPITDMMIRIRGGAFSTLYIEDIVTGRRLNINTALAATETMVISPHTWQAIIVSGVTADTWSVNQGRDVSGYVVPNVGHGSMFTTEPLITSDRALAYRVRVGGTNVTGSPTITYRARHSYL